MGSIGPAEILVVFIVALLLFGAKRLPDIARGLGTGIREFRSAMREIQTEMNVDDSRRSTGYRPPVSRTYTPPPAPVLPLAEAATADSSVPEQEAGVSEPSRTAEPVTQAPAAPAAAAADTP